MPQGSPESGGDAGHGIERSIAFIHLFHHRGRRQEPVASNRKVERVETPICGKGVKNDAAFHFHLVPQPRTGQWRQEKGIQTVDAILLGSAGDAPPDARVVYVEADDEGAHYQDFVALDTPNGSAEIAPGAQVEFLAQLTQTFGATGLEADEDAPTSRRPGQRHQLFVVREVDGGLCNPLLVQLGPGDSPKQILRPSNVVISRADKVVVDKQDTLLGNGRELGDHIRDGTLAILGSIEGSHAAEAAIQGTAARRLNRTEGIALGQ